MPVEVSLNTPLAEALNSTIQPKLQEAGLASEADAAGLAEYIVLMIVNGSTEQHIASEMAVDFLGLSPDEPKVRNFSKWLFEQIDVLHGQLNGGQAGENVSHGGADNGAGGMDTDMNANDVSELNAPTGPRSMRNGNGRGGRDKRMLGQVHKAMDRSDGVLHRVRGQTGNERINTHGRGAAGVRGGMGRGGRGNNQRASNLQAGLAAGGGQGQWMMSGQGPNQMELMAMLEQQNQMMFQLSQQLMSGGGANGGPGNQRRGGKSLFDRVQDPNRKNFRKSQHTNQEGTNGEHAGEGGGDVDMGGATREPPNPDDTTCKYNLHCTNRECKFAHQSPAAPPGVSIDVSDVCSFGAACKNRKCVGRHPSPATKLAHQGEQDCKFFPNCQNPRCPFRHPSMPLCRNGADCTTENCKFTHVRTKCKFNPCLNPSCAFAHDEGQQGGFKDKIWIADEGEHVSERKFVDENSSGEYIKPDDDMRHETAQDEAVAQEADVIA